MKEAWSLDGAYGWILPLLVTVGVVGVYFELDNPPNAPFAGLHRSTMPWRIGLGLIGVVLAVYWVWFVVDLFTRSFREIVENRKDKAIRLAQVLLVLTLATWIGTYMALNLVDYAAQSEDRNEDDLCKNASGDDTPAARQVAISLDDDAGTAAPGAGLPVLTAAESPAKIGFGPLRDQRRTQVNLQAADDVDVAPMTRSDFVVSALSDGEDVLPDKAVSHKLTVAGDRVLVDICVDLKHLVRIPSGTYKGELLYTGSAAKVMPVPIEVSVQARYLWGFVPGVWILAVLAMWLVFDRWPVGLRQQLASFIAVAAPVAVVFGVQGLQSPGWGGGLVAVGTLGAAMYVAGVGAAELVKRGGHDQVMATTTPVGEPAEATKLPDAPTEEPPK